jgi:hypothetical protein
MPWTYDQNSGRFYAPSGVEASSGISGDFLHANYGPSQRLQFAVLGPLTMDLPPIGHIAFGRNNFRIHGTKGHHWASAGCIILDPETRRQIAMSGDRVLKVK